MEWNQVLEHPSLQNIPFKIELNEWGKVVMTPASNLKAEKNTVAFTLRWFHY